MVQIRNYLIHNVEGCDSKTIIFPPLKIIKVTTIGKG